MSLDSEDASFGRERSRSIATSQPYAFVGLGFTVACVSLFTLPLPVALASTALGVLMIIGADIDARTFRLPNYVTYGAAVSGLVAAFILNPQTTESAVLAASLRGFGTAAIFLAIRRLYCLIRGQEGLGLGDVKLAGAIGVWLPLELIPVCIGFSALTALLIESTFNIRQQRLGQNTKIPFGAYLCPALWLTFFVGVLVA